ncbi:MAG: cytochrome P450 [Candidatus Binataceae bacterium]
MGDFYFNPWDSDFRDNPYPYYASLNAEPPRILDLFGPAALVARHCDVVAALKDHERFSSVRPSHYSALSPFGAIQTMLTSDPPDHSRLRRLISRDFTPRRVEGLKPRIQAITSQLLDRMAGRGAFDAIADLADVLPVMVIAELLGVPAELHEKFKTWSDAIVAGGNTPPTSPRPESFNKAREALHSYFVAQIERRRAEPGTDLISALVAAHDDNDALTADEMVAFIMLLLLAGNETTTNLIGNGTRLLAQQPGAAERLRRSPDLIPNAIEEILRYDPPVQAVIRFALTDAEIGGVLIPSGAKVFELLAAANRDPAVFKEPERFDIARTPNDHVSFGDGIHFCLGASLARLEGAIAIGATLKRFARIRLAEPGVKPVYKGSFFLRGLASLTIAVE